MPQEIGTPYQLHYTRFSTPSILRQKQQRTHSIEMISVCWGNLCVDMWLENRFCMQPVNCCIRSECDLCEGIAFFRSFLGFSGFISIFVNARYPTVYSFYFSDISSRERWRCSTVKIRNKILLEQHVQDLILPVAFSHLEIVLVQIGYRFSFPLPCISV